MRLISNRTASNNTSTWYEEGNILYFSVVPDGTTGPHWIKRLEYKGFRLGGIAKAILRSPEFKPTAGVRTQIAVVRGSSFTERYRTTRNVLAQARTKNLTPLNPEVMCLVRDKFLDKDLTTMGFFWLIGMHNPIIVDGEPYLLGSDRIEDRDGYGSFLVAYLGRNTGTWDRDTGFLFKVRSKNNHLCAV